jgi:hypothetical protein
MYARTWWEQVTAANGDPKRVEEAALTFARLIFALMMGIVSALGLSSALKPRRLGAGEKPNSGARELPERTGEKPSTGSKNEGHGHGSESARRMRTSKLQIARDMKATRTIPGLHRRPMSCSSSPSIVVSYRRSHTGRRTGGASTSTLHFPAAAPRTSLQAAWRQTPTERLSGDRRSGSTSQPL